MNLKEKIESALDSKKISGIENFELRQKLLPLLVDAQENIGMNPNEAKTETMAHKIADYCQYYKYLTLADIEIIFEAGSIGIFGETFRFNMQVVNKWFSEYCKERSNVMQDLQKSDICTTGERLQFLWENRKKMSYFNDLCNKPRIARTRSGLKRINEI